MNNSTYFGPKYSLYFIKGDYPGSDPSTRTLYQGSDKQMASKKVESAIERVQAFRPDEKGSSKISGFTLYYRGKPHLRIESIVENGVRKVVRS